MFAKLFARIKSLIQYIRENRFDRSLMRYFDWPLLIMVLTISLFGIVCIFSATSSEVSTAPSNLVEMLQTQSIAYPRLQFLWLLDGMVAMFAIIFFPYALYGRYAHWQWEPHIYLNPLYYIDYCMAGTVAFQVWTLSLQDRRAAWEKYLAFVDQAGTRTFADLCQSVGLRVPYEDGCIREVGSGIRDWLKAHAPVEA